MKIFIKTSSTILDDEVKVTLNDGTDITPDLRISKIEIITQANEITKAILTVYPSEVLLETNDGEVKFIKHPDWNTNI